MPDIKAEIFETYRSLLFSIAYRMLGSVSDAEDIVQTAYLRYQAVHEEIQSPKAFLSTIVTRLCLNYLESARVAREMYIGPWLPEPIQTEPSTVPALQVELNDLLSIAFLALLEKLTPAERAVFLLREVFSYEYVEIAAMLGNTESACRQMLSRAKKHLADRRPRFKPNHDEHHQMLTQFLHAASTGELDGLMELLTTEVTLWADGGGKARNAALQPVHGREAVARFVLNSIRLAGGETNGEIAQVNGEFSLIVRRAETVVVVLAVTLDNRRIAEIRAMGNPDKLKWIGAKPEKGDAV